MRYIIFILFFLCMKANAQNIYENTPSGILIDKQLRARDFEQKEELKDINQTGLEIDAKGKKNGSTLEWNYTYLRFAQSNISFDQKEKGNSLTFGHRQVAESFYYELQYNLLNTNNSKNKIQSATIGLGWQAAWKHRIFPYIGLQVGYSNLSNDKLNLSETGFYSGLDAGVILKRYYPFLFILGTRYGIHNYSTEKMSNLLIQELYLSIGIEIF